ncbi:serine hydrolase domain-containing protein [Aliiruegeria sabulilitoris]|uniref:serine hydrolase domain-containing protein n=1 Tax=Aliiruegeria sabulilitoris TaxID=1510458 RepID=UPI0009E74256|nr:serine hydrolase domain-containing protein [Aliiruegeria sabulilitoris]NDR57903.1 beta-lactamase family protein [Pseudoruegeria sp. M32A2M]
MRTVETSMLTGGILSWLLATAAFCEFVGVDLKTCGDAPEPPGALVEALDKLLKDTVDPVGAYSKDGMNAPGAVLLVRSTDWAYFKAAGISDFDNSAQLECEMPFEIGSATKMVTGTVLMQLQEEGRLNLTDPLQAHLPEIAGRLPFGDLITLRHLATHTSGVFSYTDDAPDGTPGIMEGALKNPDMLAVSRTPAELVEFAIAHGEPSFEAGADGHWSYSNTGYILLGLIIEKLEQAPLAEVFKRRVFEPAGMANTFLWNDVPSPEVGLSRAWYKAPFDLETTGWNLSQGWAAGGIISTAPDMALFIERLMAGWLFAKAGTLDAMADGVPAPYPNLSYGIGLIGKPGDMFGHGGQTMGFESDTAHSPTSGTTIVFWTNSASSTAVLGVPLITMALDGAKVQ